MKKSKQLLLAMTVLTALSGNVYAEEVLPTYDSEATVVTATKSEEKLLHTSADVTVITGKEIEKMHYKTMTDVLKTVPNVQVLNYAQNYTRNTILINGDTNVIVLLNGVRISQMGSGSLDMSYGFNLIRDMQDVARVEVLKGAASVLYGADAKGGVINIITKSPNKTKTTVNIEQGSFGHEAYSVNQTIHKDKLSLGLFAKKTLDGDYRDGQQRKWPYHNDAEEFGINGKILVGKDDSGSFTFNYANSKTDAHFIDISGRQQKHESKQSASTLQLRYKQKFAKGWENALTYNRHISADNFRGYEWDEYENEYQTEAEDWGTDHLKTTVVNNTVFKKFDDANHLTFGVEKIIFFNNTIDANKKTSSNSLFAQYSWDFAKNWNLLTGFRRDKFKGAGGKSFKAHNAKSFTLTHDFDENTNMYVAYNEYYRAPNSAELYRAKYGNANLIPEVGNNKEIGINHMTKDKTLISAHFFTRHSKNAIDLTKGGYTNSDRNVHGFDLNVMKAINDKWNVKAGWAHISLNEPVSTPRYNQGYLPANSITLGADYKYKKVDAGLQVRGFYGRTGDNVNYNGWPSSRYWVADLAVNYRPTGDMKLYMKLNNLTNKNYAYHTDVIHNGAPESWYSMPGRNVMFGMEYSL